MAKQKQEDKGELKPEKDVRIPKGSHGFKTVLISIVSNINKSKKNRNFVQ